MANPVSGIMGANLWGFAVPRGGAMLSSDLLLTHRILAPIMVLDIYYAIQELVYFCDNLGMKCVVSGTLYQIINLVLV